MHHLFHRLQRPVDLFFVRLVVVGTAMFTLLRGLWKKQSATTKVKAACIDCRFALIEEKAEVIIIIALDLKSGEYYCFRYEY